ncbi:glycosyltransferase family 87 protein [Streptomyces sp. JJ36]|uniref:glycosyltransferase family 87 protein n=1 Tax=Streptomyces sp. JJ36 TaxID=2736645 RepID=UPI001F2963C3|nr:glycosyltransferase family 87 protein [Streptomyces sp. JJ36]MCF6522976.1 DUF2029 domain-containing protein [Streptomyces sp. JJ36]
MRSTTAAATAVWTVTRVALLLCVFQVFTLPGPDVTSDVRVIYQGWSEVLSRGTFPQDDVSWQYPPAAALPVLAPRALPFLDYPAAFFVLACVADAVTFGLLLRAGRRPDGRAAGAWCWVAGVPLLGPTAYARYDVLVTALAVAALLTAAHRPRAAGVLAGFGALLKVWPALLLLGIPRGRPARTAWTAAAVTGGLLALAFGVAMPGAWAFLTFQGERGTEVESLGALVFHVARHFGWEGQVLLHYGSMEFLGPYVSVVSDVALALSVLAGVWLLSWRLRARRWSGSTPAEAAFTAVLLFTATSRVISPQYMVWLVGLAAVCLVLRTSRMTPPALLVLAATGVTLLEFPVWFGHVVTSDMLGIALLVVRNGLLVAACVLACRRLWRDTVTEPRVTDRAEAAVPAAAPPCRAGTGVSRARSGDSRATAR